MFQLEICSKYKEIEEFFRLTMAMPLCAATEYKLYKREPVLTLSRDAKVMRDLFEFDVRLSKLVSQLNDRGETVNPTPFRLPFKLDCVVSIVISIKK